MDNTILIVEDHDLVRKMLREWLQVAFPDCHVQVAATGERAIEVARTESIDLILMDIGLPDITGIEATRRIKSSVPQIPVVMLTIHEDRAFRAEAEAAGASAYVPKRTMQRELKPVLNEFLPACRQPHATPA